MHGKQTNNMHKYTIQSKLAKNVPTQLQIKRSTMLDEIHVTTQTGEAMHVKIFVTKLFHCDMGKASVR